MKFKKILFGEEVPDKDDTKYKERYEKDVAAGKTFAQTLKLDKGAACVQRFASRHTKLFLALVFSFVLFSVGLSLYRMTQAVKYRPQPSSAVERQEQQLHFKRHHAPQQPENDKDNINNHPHQTDEYEAFR